MILVIFMISGTSFTLEFHGPLNESGRFNGNPDRWARVILVGGQVQVVHTDPPNQDAHVEQSVGDWAEDVGEVEGEVNVPGNEVSSQASFTISSSSQVLPNQGKFVWF